MEKIECEKCGHEMINLSRGPYINVKCPNCGWNWAAYDSENAKSINDNIIVTFEGKQYTKEGLMYLTKKITGNSILSKKLLEEGGTVSINSFAEIEPELKKLGIRFNAKPE